MDKEVADYVVRKTRFPITTASRPIYYKISDMKYRINPSKTEQIKRFLKNNVFFHNFLSQKVNSLH